MFVCYAGRYVRISSTNNTHKRELVSERERDRKQLHVQRSRKYRLYYALRITSERYFDHKRYAMRIANCHMVVSRDKHVLETSSLFWWSLLTISSLRYQTEAYEFTIGANEHTRDRSINKVQIKMTSKLKCKIWIFQTINILSFTM